MRRVSRRQDERRTGPPAVYRPVAAATDARRYLRHVDSLSSGLRGVAEDLWAAATAGEQPSTRLRARWWSMLFYIFDTGRRTISDLYRSSGSAVYGTRNVVERSMRDIHAIATTFEQPIAQAFRADAGRVLAGKDPKNPAF